MNEISKPAHSHFGQDHSHSGSCCGGSDAKAKPQATPADKATEAQVTDSKTKPAGSSGCCKG